MCRKNLKWKLKKSAHCSYSELLRTLWAVIFWKIKKLTTAGVCLLPNSLFKKKYFSVLLTFEALGYIAYLSVCWNNLYSAFERRKKDLPNLLLSSIPALITNGDRSSPCKQRNTPWIWLDIFQILKVGSVWLSETWIWMFVEWATWRFQCANSCNTGTRTKLYLSPSKDACMMIECTWLGT